MSLNLELSLSNQNHYRMDCRKKGGDRLEKLKVGYKYWGEKEGRRKGLFGEARGGGRGRIGSALPRPVEKKTQV